MFGIYPESAPTASKSLAAINLASAVDGRRRLCLVSDYSDAAMDLADLLAASGWSVRWLDVSEAQPHDAAKKNHNYVRLSGQYRQANRYLPLRSLCAYHWLRDKSFDVVLFQQDFGVGYYSCIAKQLGLAFPQTHIVILPAWPLQRSLEAAARLPHGRTDIEDDYMETETVKRADAVVFPDTASAEWFRKAQWPLPSQTAQSTTTNGMNLDQWLNRIPARSAPVKPDIFISVCLATYNRSEMLRQAIESVVRQTYRHFELIVIDDGSDDPDMTVLRNEYAAIFEQRGWRWVAQDNQGPKAARNRILELGKGTHFLFMDDDNIAYPDELERFALAASHNDADILTCIVGMHPESKGAFAPTAFLPERRGVEPRPVGWTPVGASLALSVFVNCLGETNSLFKRGVFAGLGGFQGSPEIISEDIELLTRAVIAGYRLEVIPEVLFLYRRHETSRSMGEMIYKSHMESLKPIAALLPPSLSSLLLVIRHEWYERHCQRREALLAETDKKNALNYFD